MLVNITVSVRISKLIPLKINVSKIEKYFKVAIFLKKYFEKFLCWKNLFLKIYYKIKYYKDNLDMNYEILQRKN